MMSVQETTLKISGMTCDHCVQTVEKKIKSLGVQGVQVDLSQQQAKIQYDPAKTSLDQIKQAVRAAGYQVTG
jgi:copper chaperone